MALELMYITNSPEIALIAEENGVGRVWIDLETLGKQERQKNIDSVKSRHTLRDVEIISDILTDSECMVRINPWNDGSAAEIENVIAAGADRIMLPMWRTAEEARAFLTAVNNRISTTLLLETREAAEQLDEVLLIPEIDEIHVGLNDLHLSYGLTFMFELLANGTVERLCDKMRAAGVPYGFGGVASIGEGLLPAENIVMEHYRLGSTRAILSRSFCNADDISDHDGIKKIFSENMSNLRNYEASIRDADCEKFLDNAEQIKRRVAEIVRDMKSNK